MTAAKTPLLRPLVLSVALAVAGLGALMVVAVAAWIPESLPVGKRHRGGLTALAGAARHVTGNRDNDYVGAAAVNSYSLKGAGLSVAWLSGFGLSLKASWARRIGANPNPTLAGNDQDGSLDKNRFWLQAKLPF